MIIFYLSRHCCIEMSTNSPSQLNDDIYENIPEVVEGLVVNNNNKHVTPDMFPDNDEKLVKISINNNDNLPMNNLMNHKDALYATPLRKSDRHKSRKSPSLDGEKISNLNHHNNSIGVDDPELKNLMDRTFLNSELGENRIKDFLKDTAHMHKKMEPPGKEHIGSSFSYLARKEHFVNLVNQNVLKDQNVVEEELMNASR